MTLTILPPHHEFDTDKMNIKSDAVYNMLAMKSRTHFGRPAASLTQLDDPVLHGQLPKGWKRQVLEVAREGEEETSSMILDWMTDKPYILLFDSVHIKGDETTIDKETGLLDNGDTDHVLTCGNNVLIIDSKRWKGGWKAKNDPILPDGNRPIRNSVYWVDYKGQVLRFGKEFPGGKVHMGAAIRLWKNYLHTNDGNVHIEGMIHIVTDHTEVSRDRGVAIRNNNAVYRKQGWKLVEKDMLTPALDEWLAGIDNTDRFISTDLTTLIATQCCTPYDRRKGLINTDLLQ